MTEDKKSVLLRMTQQEKKDLREAAHSLRLTMTSFILTIVDLFSPALDADALGVFICTRYGTQAMREVVASASRYYTGAEPLSYFGKDFDAKELVFWVRSRYNDDALDALVAEISRQQADDPLARFAMTEQERRRLTEGTWDNES